MTNVKRLAVLLDLIISQIIRIIYCYEDIRKRITEKRYYGRSYER